MFGFKPNPVLLRLVSKRHQELASFKRLLSCSKVSAAKESYRNRRQRKLEKQNMTEHVNKHSPPIAVQMLSKTLDFSSYLKQSEKTETLTEAELRQILEELTWDEKAAIYKLKQSDLKDAEEKEFAESKNEDEGQNPKNMDEDFIETITLDEEMETKKVKQDKTNKFIVGSPDQSVPKSEIPCSGCGAELHCQDPIVPGYMPSEKFKGLTKNDLRQSICQRCNLLSYHNICLNVNVDADEYPKIISKIKDTRGLVIVIVDVTDIRNSIFPNLLKYIGKNRPLYIVGNKVDLVPKDNVGYLSRIKDTLIQECEDLGLNYRGKNIKHACLVSAKTGYGIEELVTNLMTDWRLKGEVFLVGCTNVGKSSVFNALLQSDYCKSIVRDLIKRATVSVWPGTTLNLLKFPIISPDGWRIQLRMSRLMRERSKKMEEEKLQKSKQQTAGETKYASLHGYIGQTDFRGERAKQTARETEREFEGQELVSFSLSESGDFTEVSGRRQIMKETTPPDMSVFNSLKHSKWTYDTPGVTNPEQIINLLTPEELQLVLPKKLYSPRVFVVKPGQTMFVSGLARIDYCQGEKSIFLTVHCSFYLPVHVLNTTEADSFYEEKLGTKSLAVPIGDSERLQKLPPLVGREFQLTGIGWDMAAADVQLSSLGWVSAMIHQDHDVLIRAHTPGGKGCHMRTPALLPHVLSFRGERIKGTAGYTPRK